MLTICHCCPVQRQDLRALVSPTCGRRRPVPHGVLADLIVDAAAREGLVLTHESWGLVRGSAHLYAVLDFKPSDMPPGCSPSLALIHGTDGRLSTTVAAGVRVAPCGNGALIAALNLPCRQTPGLHPQRMADKAIGWFVDRIQTFPILHERLTSRALGDAAAKCLIFDLFMRFKVLPPRYMAYVASRYFSGEHERQFPGRDRWRVYMAVSEIIKNISTPLQLDAFRRLNSAMGIRP
jgi:hypothetical protein